MALTAFNIKNCLLCVLCLTHYANVYAGRFVSHKKSAVGYISTDGLYGKHHVSYGDTPSPISYYGSPLVSDGYYHTSPSIGGYYYTSPPLPPTPPPTPKKTKKSTNALALGLGLGLGLGVPSLLAGVGYYIYKHPTVLPWMWRPL
jgi:hypothetical protein